MAAKTMKVTIGEVEYVLQHPGARWYTQHSDRSNRTGILNQEKYIDGLLEMVVIECPEEMKIKGKLTLDSFDDNMGDLELLIVEIEGFLRGK